MASSCENIRWHYIGSLQKKSLNHVLKSPNLTSVQTISKFELIKMVEDRISAELTIMIQINTSGESEKSGFDSEKFDGFFFNTARGL